VDYDLTFDYKTAGTTEGNPYLRWIFNENATIDEDGKVSGNFIGQETEALPATGGSWDTYSVTASGYTGTDLAAFTRYTKNGNKGSFDGEVWIDNVTVVPEPATMLILLLAAGGLLIRRKICIK